MQIKIKEVEKKDYCDLDETSSELIKDLCGDIKEKYLLTLPYGMIIWKDDKIFDYRGTPQEPLHFEGAQKIIDKYKSFCDKCKNPVGIVIKGIFEVFDYIPGGGKSTPSRPQANILLKPGNIFGLYETFADLHGQWYISAGVKSIFISNHKGFGASKVVGNLADTLKHTKKSDYDYSKVVERLNVSINDWNAQCIIFDAKKITKTTLRDLLYRMTIKQLVALVRQHPQLVICDPNELKNIDVNIRDMARTLDAMIDGEIPIHTLATDKDHDYLPFSILTKFMQDFFPKGTSIENIDGSDSNEKKQVWVDIWRPCLLDTSHKIGVYFPKVANKFIRGDISDLIYNLASKNNDGQKTFMEISSGGSIGWIDKRTLPGMEIMSWTTKYSKINARVIPYALKKSLPKFEAQDINTIIERFLIQNERKGLDYGWPKHINTAYVIELE